MIEIKCKFCGENFKVFPYRKESAKYCSKKCMGKDENSNWAKSRFKDGHENLLEPYGNSRGSKRYCIWREAVFKRDGLTCQDCGEANRKRIIPHHIKKFDEYPELRFAIDNGITVCRKCHLKRHPEIIENAKKNNIGKKHKKEHKEKISRSLKKTWKQRKLNNKI